MKRSHSMAYGKVQAAMVLGVLLFVLCASLAFAEEAKPGKGEYRTAWVLTFEGELLSSKEGIKKVVEVCRGNNLNAVVPVVRRRGRAYYDSKLEPKYHPDPEKPVEFDAMAEFVKSCHDTSGGKQRLEVHAWVVVGPIWMEEKEPPAGHVLKLHPEWMTQNFDLMWSEKTPQRWVDLGVPEVEDYTVAVCNELAKNYEIDGINLDYIRYREGGFGYNPVALKRFQKRYNRSDRPSPEDPQWQEWRREQVSNLVRRIYVETKKLRPELKLSVCTITWGSIKEGFEKTRAYTDALQDWLSWAKEGIFDVNTPMIYKRETVPEQKEDYRDWTRFMVENEGETISVVGLGAYLNATSDTISQIKDARKLGADGFCIFRLVVNNKERKPWQEFLQTLKKEVFSSTVPVPEWVPFNKRNYGMLCGKVYEGDKPVDSVEVTLADSKGKARTTRSSGAGYYAFVKLPAGEYELKTKVGEKAFSTKVKISNGQVATEDIRIK